MWDKLQIYLGNRYSANRKSLTVSCKFLKGGNTFVLCLPKLLTVRWVINTLEIPSGCQKERKPPLWLSAQTSDGKLLYVVRRKYCYKIRDKRMWKVS